MFVMRMQSCQLSFFCSGSEGSNVIKYVSPVKRACISTAFVAVATPDGMEGNTVYDSKIVEHWRKAGRGGTVVRPRE